MDHPDVARSMGATRMDVPGARRVHLTTLSSVRFSSVSFEDLMVHASSVIEIIDCS